MANFHELQKRAKAIKPKRVRVDLFNYIKTIEKIFIDANIEQLEQHKNSKGNQLRNSDASYTGFYSRTTELYANLSNPKATKKAGDPYNFLWSGEFLSGFESYITTGKVEIGNTGTGAGKKADFFDGYTDLFGVTMENLAEINKSKLLPFMQLYYRNRLKV
ncbi:MAG: hypothetical protein MK105_15180 [Crocinitomicaceae bacterium]|nr:hypothetical protein [Crocinitomicaceae bacterium]